MSSKLGWILSGVLVAALLVFVIVRLAVPSPSEPTADSGRAGFLDLHQVSLSPAGFLGFEPAGDGDAADDYRRGVQVYNANEDAITRAYDRCKDITAGKFVPELPVMEAVKKVHEHLAAGAPKKAMNYSTPQHLVVRRGYQPADELTHLSEAMSILASFHYFTRNGAEIETVLRNQFVLGWHMANERTRATMTEHGLDVQLRALNTLEDLYANWEAQANAVKRKAVGEYLSLLRRVLHLQQNKLELVWKLRPQPGDLYRIVERDQDRAWRVEALLMLGAVRYTHKDHRGDSRVTAKLLDRFAASTDPFVKAAAVAARDLTPEGFQRIAR